MKKISILLVVLMSAFSILFVGCGKKDNNKVRISEVTHSLFYAPLYVAINNGYFEELKKAITPFQGNTPQVIFQ